MGRLRFAVVTCAKYAGYFNAYARIAEADVDLVLHCGDYFYEGTQDRNGPPERLTSPPTEVRTLADDLSEDPFDPRLPSAAVEFVTPSISNSNFDEGLGVPPRTTSLAVEQALQLQNPNTRYAELDSNGWVLIDVTRERVQAEFLFVDTVMEPSDGQRLDATWQVLRGAQRLSPGGPRTEPRRA